MPDGCSATFRRPSRTSGSSTARSTSPADGEGKHRSHIEGAEQIVRIEWDSAEGHLQGFRQSADFKPFLAATQPFFNDIEEMTHYQVTANG
jgi:hypothetical protein